MNSRRRWHGEEEWKSGGAEDDRSRDRGIGFRRKISALVPNRLDAPLDQRRDVAADLAPKFYPVLSSLQRFFEVLPDFGPAGLEFSGVLAQFGGGADEPFISEIGTLLPMALCGRNSLYNTTTEHPQDGGS
ncbi:hypothetical protein [Rhizobium laguerreae]|uniref:hypothetical protein n=1 Tax=Rhizobium laguerreae TaxID=1076926 RepID=UPI00197DAABF|nr:hypothetical protein [Rhizobium laguerreae]